MTHGAALLALVAGCTSCWFDITETDPSEASATGAAATAGSGAGSSGMSGSGAAGSGGWSRGGAGPGCPSDGCPMGSHCDDAQGVCIVEPQPICGGFVFVDEEVRFLGDTCVGLEFQGCGGVMAKHLMFQLGGSSSWEVTSVGAQIGDMEISCDGGLMGCGSRVTIPKGTLVTVRSKAGCKELIIDVVPR